MVRTRCLRALLILRIGLVVSTIPLNTGPQSLLMKLQTPSLAARRKFGGGASLDNCPVNYGRAYMPMI